MVRRTGRSVKPEQGPLAVAVSALATRTSSSSQTELCSSHLVGSALPNAGQVISRGKEPSVEICVPAVAGFMTVWFQATRFPPQTLFSPGKHQVQYLLHFISSSTPKMLRAPFVWHTRRKTPEKEVHFGGKKWL